MLTLAFSFLSLAYLLCFLLGLGYAVLAAVFSAFSGGGGGESADIGADLHGGGEIDLGGGHDVVSGVDVDAADVGGHVPGDVVNEPGVSPFSPPVIAIGLITFGGAGIIFTEVFHWQALSLVPAAGSGVGMGVLTFFLFYTVVRKIQGSSSPSLEEMIGLEAETTTPVPADGVGEIAYVCRGSRFTARARAVGNETLPTNSAVVITRWVGHTAYVKPSE